MKKFYTTLALAAAVAMSATAAEKVAQIQPVELTANEVVMEAIANGAKPAKAAVQKAYPQTIDDLCGVWDMLYEGVTQGASDNEPALFLISKYNTSPTDSRIKIVGFYAAYEAVATVNLRAGTITFAGNQQIGMMTNSDTNQEEPLYLRHYTRTVDQATSKYIFTDCKNQTVIWDIQDDGSIKCRNEVDLMWVAREAMFAELSLYAAGLNWRGAPRVDDPSEWETVGEATLVDDGWINPMWIWNDGSNGPQYTCNYQRNVNNPNIVRLYNPYGTFNEITGGDDNIATVPGSIVMDITNPGCVFVLMNYFSGYQSDGDGLLFLYNQEAVMQAKEGASAEDLIGYFGDAISKMDASTGLIEIQNTRFGFTGREEGALNWNDYLPADSQCSNTATILIPEDSGIGNIIVDENAPVEYFNLQGIKVANPENGLFIRRQGKQVTKVIR